MYIVNNNELSIDKKRQYLVDNLDRLSMEEQTQAYLSLLGIAKNAKDDKAQFEFYNRLAFLKINSYSLHEAKLYLDSASVYESKVTEPEYLAFHNHALGDYFNHMLDETTAHDYYYKAMVYYEMLENSHPNIVSLYHNLSFSYIQRQDVDNLKKLLDKAYPLVVSKGKITDLVNTYRITSYYYSCLYSENKAQKALLDSAIYYDRKVIALFENQKDGLLYPDEIAYNYVHLAENMLEKDRVEYDSVMFMVDKARQQANPLDTAMIINCLWIEGLVLYKKGYQDAALFKMNEQLEMMNNWNATGNLSMFVDLYGKLSEISVNKGNLEKALFYEKKKADYISEIQNKKRYEVIQELQTKYDVDKKEQEIKQLKEINRYQNKIKYLIISICLLILLFSTAIVFWFRVKKRRAVDKLRITEMEKTEIEYQKQLKDAQFEIVQLEKYEALLGSHFKDAEIDDRDKELEQLKKEQNDLNKLISDYSDKLKSFEEKKKNKLAGALKDVDDIFSKELSSFSEEQHAYRTKLLRIGSHFENHLTSKGLSNINIQYCVCFALGMDTKLVARCFSVKEESVRTVRNRIKSELCLEKNEKLDVYLFNLVLQTN